MIVYEVYDPSGFDEAVEIVYVPTKKKAVCEALRRSHKTGDGDLRVADYAIEINRLELPDSSRQQACNMLNGKGWVNKREIVGAYLHGREL